VVAVAILDDVRFSVRRKANVEFQSQAQWYAAGAESLAMGQIAGLLARGPARTPLQPAWNGRPVSFPIDGGTLTATVTDGQACFNLNSVALGFGEDLTGRPLGAAQFRALGRAVGVPDSRIRMVADSLTDWLDADTTPSPLGAEDGAYAGLATAYRTGGAMLAEVSELRAVKGVDAETYRRLRPFLCALPLPAVSAAAGLDGQPPSLSISLTRGMNSAITMPPTITASTQIMIGSIMEVNASTARSTSSS
jgi:general secretion pathway protein K